MFCRYAFAMPSPTLFEGAGILVGGKLPGIQQQHICHQLLVAFLQLRSKNHGHHHQDHHHHHHHHHQLISINTHEYRSMSINIHQCQYPLNPSRSTWNAATEHFRADRISSTSSIHCNHQPCSHGADWPSSPFSKMDSMT